MPPRPSPAADRYRPLGAPAPTQRLRDVSGGNDLQPLPFYIAPRDGESPVSWLRRLAVRYGVPARDLLRTAGVRQPVHSTSRAVNRLRNNCRLLLALGLSDDEAAPAASTDPQPEPRRRHRRSMNRVAEAASRLHRARRAAHRRDTACHKTVSQ